MRQAKKKETDFLENRSFAGKNIEHTDFNVLKMLDFFNFLDEIQKKKPAVKHKNKIAPNK